MWLKKIVLLTFFSFIATVLSAQERFFDYPEDDTIRTHIDELVVKYPRKETSRLFDLPMAISLFDSLSIKNMQSESLKELTRAVPNMYIPEYGTKLTSTSFIRGVGSRMNTPSIGLYVNNVPHLNRSTFDFDFYDIDYVEVLRGAQGTLYGRNAIGGIVNIYTLSPLKYSGTNLNLSAANHSSYRANVAHYAKIGEYMGASIGVNYNSSQGFFKNEYDGTSADKISSYGSRVQFAYQKNRLKADFSVDFENSKQNGFPYSLYELDVAKAINHNDPNDYKRKLLSTGISLGYNANRYTINATTAFQYFNDEMNLDQDFSPASIFTLNQKQRQASFSQEIIVKSKPSSTKGLNYQWLAGAFGFYQNINTQGPVTLKKDGISTIIQPVFDRLFESGQMPFHIKVKDDEILIGGNFKTPTLGGALFHQSTLNNLGVEGLSLTAGIRLDYESMKIDYFSSSAMTLGLWGDNEVVKADTIGGDNSKKHIELLPKVALKYAFDQRNNIYASLAKGYKSGGYNIQMFSDVMQEKMASRESNEDAVSINERISFDPEYNWNFELGARGELIPNILYADFAAFYIKMKNQQIVQFAPNGLGRLMKNAGESTSYGLELNLRAKISSELTLSSAYGYTHATFNVYNDTIRKQGSLQAVSYAGNFVPMVPRHTFLFALDYQKKINSDIIDKIACHLQYYAYGKTYWNEQNSASRKYLGGLNAKVSFIKNRYQLSVWSKNILNEKQNAFYFESMGKAYVQRAKGFQLGLDFNVRF